MSETLTASRAATLLACQRKHYYRYELGLASTADSLALRFGSAWHRGMEKYAVNEPFDAALEYALTVKSGEEPIDEVESAKLYAMLKAYYEFYGENVNKVYPECQFVTSIRGSRTFQSAGKIDGLIMGESVGLLEHKTTSESVAADSDYWLRLRWNYQLLTYVDACEDAGHHIDYILYDVVRKPTIAPKNVPTIDEYGKKIVLDSDGNRVFKKDGEPRESGDTAKGYFVCTHLETAEEYCQRLYDDVKERPEFYFARKEVPFFAEDLQNFREQRLQIGRLILMCRASEKKCSEPAAAWIRNCSDLICRTCEYQSFCLRNETATPDNLPEGFKLVAPNQELERL